MSGHTRPKRRGWQPHELEVLKRFYADLRTEDLARILKRDPSRVYAKAHQLGLHKSEAFLESVHSGRIQRARQHPSMVASQFKPGLTPWNKGLHVVAGGRSAETRFKQGSKPHNTKGVGDYRINLSHGVQVLERKMAETPGPNHLRWVPVARLVWEAAHGPVPAGQIVVFRTPALRTTVLEQITLDKLECITRAEHARRNHPRSKSPELAKLVQLKGAITRQVNRITREANERTAA